jgi:UDP-N-acetylmuramoyl-tripeptide--D-alanyl-D-alanine ligase
MLYLSEINRLLGGKLVHAPIEIPVNGISIDSRRIRKGELFVALKGKKFDGHQFVMEAITRGAAGALVEKRMPFLKAQVIVPDPLAAMGRLAQAYRMTLGARVIAVTGSNGKTTTKEMIAHILAGQGTVVKAPASYNNEVGVPLTILKAQPETDYLVLEIGANRKGEIAKLGSISRPDAALVTSVGPSHLEGFSNVRTVAREKLSLLEHIRTGGFGVLNVDDPFLRRFAREHEDRVVTVSLFSSTRGAHFHPEEIHDGNGLLVFRLRGTPVHLNLYGVWNIVNALEAIAVCTSYGVSIPDCAERLASFRPPRMRMERLTIDGVTILNDAYNSNPVSAENSLREFEKLPRTGRKIVVLGDMAELGRASKKAHMELGQLVAGMADIDLVIAVGQEIVHALEQVRGEKSIRYFPEVREAADFVISMAAPGDQILLKASRIVELERILAEWVRREPQIQFEAKRAGA